ncbi:MAG TPA: ABC transporter substrate-binding protein [Ruminococcaceae bacterium]|nr:ABC transporter substrate-binding protein [Oscillospiraceae bacterium]
MRKMKNVFAAVVSVAMLLPMAACANPSGSTGNTNTSANAASASGSTVTMSTNAEFEPFEYKAGGKIVGIDVELSNKIAAKLGKKLQVRDVDFSALITELQSGKCDFVAAGMTENADRKKNVDFSVPYFDATQSIIVRKGSAIKSRKDLNGKKVGVQQGTTGDDYCTDEKHTSDIKVGSIKRYNKGSDAVSDLISGRVDAVVIDDYPARKFVSKNIGKITKLSDALTVEHYAVAVKKGNTSLLNTINGVIKEMKSNGELDKIVAKYKSNLENSD